MYPIFNECPICGGEMVATQLECRECDTKINGRFITGAFANLSIDQLEFVELFIRNEGKITRMESDLNLSYPTIRNRLHEIIRAMGYEPGADEGSPTEETRREILNKLEEGEIDYEEALNLLRESEIK